MTDMAYDRFMAGDTIGLLRLVITCDKIPDKS